MKENPMLFQMMRAVEVNGGMQDEHESRPDHKSSLTRIRPGSVTRSMGQLFVDLGYWAGIVGSSRVGPVTILAV